jgi:hypothetical protein
VTVLVRDKGEDEKDERCFFLMPCRIFDSSSVGCLMLDLIHNYYYEALLPRRKEKRLSL